MCAYIKNKPKLNLHLATHLWYAKVYTYLPPPLTLINIIRLILEYIASTPILVVFRYLRNTIPYFSKYTFSFIHLPLLFNRLFTLFSKKIFSILPDTHSNEVLYNVQRSSGLLKWWLIPTLQDDLTIYRKGYSILWRGNDNVSHTLNYLFLN